MVAVLVMMAAAGAAGAADGAGTSFKVYVESPGAYRVTHEDLVEAGMDPVELDSELIGLSNRGEPVPIFVDDGGDGGLGPGDWIEFLGERLSGDGLYFHEYSKFNVYWLTVDGSSVLRMGARSTDPTVMFERPTQLWRRFHAEWDQLMIRVREQDLEEEGSEDLWFWRKMTQIDPKPTEISLRLNGLDSSSQHPVDVTVGVRGMSRPSHRHVGELAHHRVDVTLNGTSVGSSEWNGRLAHVVELRGLDAGLFRPGQNELSIAVPARTAEEGADPLVDVVMLNWVDVVYPHTGRIGDEGQHQLFRSPYDVVEGDGAPGPTGPVEIRGVGGVRMYTAAGERVAPFVVSGGVPGVGGEDVVRLDPGTEEGFIVTAGDLRTVDLVLRDDGSSLAETDQQADYLMIAHRKLIESIQPLADFHRERGLTVQVVDVEDIYDEFNHGIIHPKAIRDFVAHAYHQWQPPAPRFVLLVGDASWDTKNTKVDDRNYANWVDNQLEQGVRFVARKGPVYAEKSALNHRQLVPTWNYTSHQGHSASDNFFVAVDGDDFYPDLAIGRFPLVEPDEVEDVIRKTVSYMEQSKPGPWQRNTLWITNESSAFQRNSDVLAESMARRGLAAWKVYPSPDEADNVMHQSALQDRLNDGQLLVHFLGHGGRHIWRTGPPDFRKNHDLFTLDHVAELEATNRLSFVLSMTCYSAPFDHPNQDSIGEYFLRVPEKGAVGVFGASWRNSPSRGFSQALLDELTAPGATVGEAIMRAKAETTSRTLVETYNLLGDPAVQLAIPPAAVELEVQVDPDRTTVHGTVAGTDLTAGNGFVEWLDADLTPIHTERVVVEGGSFSIELDGSADHLAEAHGVQVWVTNESTGAEAVGWWQPEAPEDETSGESAGPDAEARTAKRTAAASTAGDQGGVP
jgi:hypothetical protein